MRTRAFTCMLFVALLALGSCMRLKEDDQVGRRMPEGPAPKVPVSFQIQLPNDGPSTKAMDEKPQIKNIVVAVFGDAGYFNEWVPAEATTVMATENGISYNLSVKLTMSASRLRLHIIANCPADLVSNPPITGISTQDTEEMVMSKVRSRLGDQYQNSGGTYNIEDGYWQKIYLPYGIEAEVEENGNGEVVYKTDANGIVATELTKNQFIWLSPVPLVRNFARVQLQVAPSVMTEWDITHVGLVNAPAKGSIAPILASPYKVDIWGARLHVIESYTPDPSDPDNELLGTETVVAYPILSDNEIQSGQGLHLQGHERINAADSTDRYKPIPTVGMMYDEIFVTNYHNLPLYTDSLWRKVTDPPFNYGGSSPIPLEFAPNPTSDADLTPITDITEVPFLYVYERTKPRVLNGKAEQPTRLLIKAKQKNVAGASWRYFPLDIVDGEGNYLALLRNNTYYVVLTGIDKDAGSEDIVQAALSSGSNVSEDPQTQDLNEVSDGLSSLAVEYIDKTLVNSGTYTLMYRYFPVLSENEQNNDAVSFSVGFAGGSGGFEPDVISGNGAVFSGAPQNPAVSIEKDLNNKAKLYVRSGNGWAEATTAAERKTAWSMITYTTVNGNTGTDNKYFDYATNQTIRVTGINPGNNKKLFRDVQINLTMIQDLNVECVPKYVERGTSKSEDFVIHLPLQLTRSVFPLELKIEAVQRSITPRDGDNLPASSGPSIIPANNNSSSFYYIRTVSRQDYMSYIEEHPNTTDVPITCKFKTTKDDSATAIYVSNMYFNTASDNFLNYDKRLFTGLAFSNLRQEGDAAYVSFSYNVDAAHTGTAVWDNNNGGTLPSTVKVMPRIISFEFTNLSPVTSSGDLIQNGFFKKGASNTYYLYEVPNLTPANHSFSFRVLDPGNNFGVKIHTKDLTYDSAQPSFVPNPILFDEASTSYTVTPVTGISVTPTTLSMIRGSEQTLTVNYTPAGATFKIVKWTSNNPSVATVDANGKVTAVGNGTAVITAEALPVGSGVRATCVVTVADIPLTSVSLPATTSMIQGGTVTLTPTFNPANASIQSIVWSTSNGNVANVDQTGTVTGVAGGTADITVTVQDYSGNTRTATCRVTVNTISSVTITTTNEHYPQTGNNRSYTSNGVTLTFSNLYEVQANYVRPGRSSTITITAANKTITKVTITFRDGYTYNYSGGTLSGTTWTSGTLSSQNSYSISHPYDRSIRITSVSVESY